MKSTLCVCVMIGVMSACQDASNATSEIQVDVVTVPDATAGTNSYYPSNKAPLKPSVLIKLPVGDIKPHGWLMEYLQRQKNGLTGRLNEISAWLQKENNAWLDENGQGEWGWEEVPYWLKGYANIGYILDDQAMIDEAKIWIDGAIASQQPNGFFGPNLAWESYISEESRTEERMAEKLEKRDYWANMIMLYCLQSYYEYSQDERVIELMTKYFKYQLEVPDENFLSETQYWQRIRGGDNLHSVLWLYNRTGEPWLLELAEKVHRNTAPWNKENHDFEDIGNPKHIREGMEWPEWYNTMIDWHNVNVAQAFREPAQYYLLSGDEKDLRATYDNFHRVRKYFGQVPGGMFGSDENSRPGYDDPRQGVETCGMVEQMNSDEHLLRITGDIFWADHAEEVAFNTYPAAVAPDFKSLRYITSPNMAMNDNKNHNPGIDNSGPYLMMNPFSSRCCQHNHTQGWPYYVENLWMATPDNGLAAVLYAANTVTAKVGNQGKEVTITNHSNYPFEDTIDFKLSMESPDQFPLYFRIPGWASNATISVNGNSVNAQIEAGKYVKINKEWNNEDIVQLKFPMELDITTWEQNHNSISVNYGPLTFSLKIGEDYVQTKSEENAQHDSKWQEGANVEEWPSYEIHPTTPWNYGLVLKEDAKTSFEVEHRPWPSNNFPFTPDSAPILLKARAKRIPGWTFDQYGLTGELSDSPVKTETAEETVELVPMGAARLRISAFPVIGEGEDANGWN
ncbi:glycoside hydrolase family 127 protein [Muricauda sp. CAU 1633]|uniref:beta-L-arabinofuranosidase domain-containing protein n=1 Tax=Allomuricauda sp. CAU 1633 TaxID=2816036 RepID=UPI001A8BF985|nr:beta-L-arabinofuranosidase domain-containing protein [Muricauda sp. CAU 1633]MBO0321513.1 glycoside hydrolase family 127 protein [Muricauda sp. CAU 1633]